MRRITGAVFLSLDGVMQAPGGPSEDYTGGFDEGGWLFRFGDDGIFETIGSLFAGDYGQRLGVASACSGTARRRAYSGWSTIGLRLGEL